MGLTQLFIIICIAGIVLGIGFAMLSAIAGENSSNVLSILAGIMSALFGVAAVIGLVGSLWSWNYNSRQTHNRCVENGGLVMRVNESMHCLEEAPKIKFKM